MQVTIQAVRDHCYQEQATANGVTQMWLEYKAITLQEIVVKPALLCGHIPKKKKKTEGFVLNIP